VKTPANYVTEYRTKWKAITWNGTVLIASCFINTVVDLSKEMMHFTLTFAQISLTFFAFTSKQTQW